MVSHTGNKFQFQFGSDMNLFNLCTPEGISLKVVSQLVKLFLSELAVYVSCSYSDMNRLPGG